MVFDSLKKENKYFVVRSGIAPIYKEPSFSSEQTTEAINGESLIILKEKKNKYDSWFFVEQFDKYRGWIKSSYGSLENEAFKGDYITTEISKLPFAARLQLKNNEFVDVNGEKYNFVSKPQKIFKTISPNDSCRSDILINARKFLKTPYRWGGKTSYGLDCSGFVQTVFLSVSFLVPRDSGDQFNHFKNNCIKPENSKEGDLHFFGSGDGVNHVGISTGGYGIIHSRGEVKEEEFDINKNLCNRTLANTHKFTCSITLLK